jgi:hypothetical protein
MVRALDNIEICIIFFLLSSFQCIPIHLQLDQASFVTQALLGPSSLVNKCFDTQMARGLLQDELIILLMLVSFLGST